jgi:amidase
MKRRDFAKSVAATLGMATALRPQTAVRGRFSLSEVSIADLQDQMARGRTTSRRLVDQYVSRIASLDQQGPRLHHVLEVNPEARSIADRLDAERRSGQVRGPLHGIPILIKDNIATADRMETTAGSLALLGARPPRDSGVARKLREAGAVILGKTNLSEWANYRSTRSSSGWSARGGQCRNPYMVDRSPGGSSSGSAVAAAVSSCAAAIGTETNGSIIYPSSVCGIVGMKPTVGLISRAGIIPISRTQDTAGPMGRTVMDVAIVLTALAGSDSSDAATAEADRRKADYARSLDKDALRGARIGVVRPANPPPKVAAAYTRSIALLKEYGAELVDPVTLPGVAGADVLLEWEFKAGIEQYLAEWAPSAPMRTLADLIAFNEKEAAREMAYFGQELFEQSVQRGPLSSTEYTQLRERIQRQSRVEGLDAVIGMNRLDALVSISSPQPARPFDLILGDSGGGGGGPGIAALAGYPNVSVPMGFVQGLPLGLSFVGTAWTDAALLRFAYAFEQASRVRRAPEFLPTAPM